VISVKAGEDYSLDEEVLVLSSIEGPVVKRCRRNRLKSVIVEGKG
jgi:hypothetical protein